MDESIEIVSTTAVAVGGVWPHEEQDFTPWLAHHLGYLDILGLGPLDLIDTEVRVEGGRSLDILAEFGSRRRIVIENQYGVANRDHFIRGMHYAEKVGAEALVIVAERFGDLIIGEVTDRNRRVLESGGAGMVYLVSLAVEKIDGRDMPYRIPRFEVIASPNRWTAPIPVITESEFLLACGPRRGWVEELFSVWRGLGVTDVRPGRGKRIMGLWLAPNARPPVMVIEVELPSARLYVRVDDIVDFFGSDTTSGDEVRRVLRDMFGAVTNAPSFPRIDEPSSDGVAGFGRWLLDRL